MAIHQHGTTGQPAGQTGQALDLTTYKREQYNVLVPTARLQQISPFHQLRVEEVQIDPNPAAGDVYKVGSTKVGDRWQDVLALSKTALLRLAAAAGIVWNWHDTKVLSASRDYVRYQAVGAIRKSSGEWIPIKATKEIDLSVVEEELRQPGRDGEAPSEAKLSAAMIQWRKNKLMRAETGAMLRVVRALLSIKHQYSPAELARPFVVPRVDFAPDPSDPTVRRMMLEQGARAMGELFGPSVAAAAAPGLPPAQTIPEYRQALGPAVQVDDDDEPELPPVQVPLEDRAAEASTTAEAPGQLFPDQQPSAGAACADCGKPVTDKVHDYSLKRFGRPVCYACQRKGQ